MKKKKNRKKWIVLFVCLFLLASATTGMIFVKKNTDEEMNLENEVVVQEGQTLMTVTIQKMIGNEMTGRKTQDTQMSDVQTWTIPVGTEVVTKLGTVTTFARLAGGDVVQVLADDATQDILKIWIIQ